MPGEMRKFAAANSHNYQSGIVTVKLLWRLTSEESVVTNDLFVIEM
jgi:hypothetical protein